MVHNICQYKFDLLWSCHRIKLIKERSLSMEANRLMTDIYVKSSPLLEEEDSFRYKNRLGKIAFSVDPMELMSDWPKIGVLADNIAQYISLSYVDRNNYKTTESCIKFILNELIENAVKYCYKRSDIIIQGISYEKEITLEIKNQCTNDQLLFFNNFLNELSVFRSSEDYEQATIKYIKIRKEDLERSSSSRIGFISILKDYPIRVAINAIEIGVDINYIEVTCDLRI